MRILLVTTRWPWPPRRGNQLRAVQMASALASEHLVTVLAPARHAAQDPAPAGLSYGVETYPARAGAAALGLLRALGGGRPLQSGFYHQPGLRAALHRLAPVHGLAIAQLVRLVPHLSDFGATPLVVDLIDSLALNLARRAELDRPWRRPLLRFEAARLGRWEDLLVARARRTWLVCERDRAAVCANLASALAARVRVLPIVVEPATPNGITRGSSTRLPTLVVTGNLGYFPTVDGVCWFLRTVWPLLRPRCGDLRLLLAGSRPAARLVREVARVPGVELQDSPSDLAAVLRSATIALAPTRGGSGVSIKILEAWAAGVPVVATPWAAAGTTGVAGEDLLVAESAQQWIAAIGHLLDEPAAGQRLASNARHRLAADYSADRFRMRLLAEVSTAAAQTPT